MGAWEEANLRFLFLLAHQFGDNCLYFAVFVPFKLEGRSLAFQQIVAGLLRRFFVSFALFGVHCCLLLIKMDNQSYKGHKTAKRCVYFDMLSGQM